MAQYRLIEVGHGANLCFADSEYNALREHFRKEAEREQAEAEQRAKAAEETERQEAALRQLPGRVDGFTGYFYARGLFGRVIMTRVHSITGALETDPVPLADAIHLLANSRPFVGFR